VTQGDTPFEIDLLGTRFAIETPDSKWAAFLHDLWREFESEPSTTPERVRIFYEGDRTWLELPRERPLPFEDPWTLAEVARYWLVERAVTAARLVVPLHAAALTKGGRGALFAGPSGAGKTTLAVVLAQAGWALASDDIAPIDVATGAVHAFPKPLNVRAAIAGLPAPRVPWPPPAKGPRLVPADAFGRQRAPFRPDLLFFIAYEPDDPPLLEPVPPGRATAESIEYVREGGAASVGALARLCRGAAAWRIRYPNSDEAVALVEKVSSKSRK
jgi:hypothetical protein